MEPAPYGVVGSYGGWAGMPVLAPVLALSTGGAEEPRCSPGGALGAIAAAMAGPALGVEDEPPPPMGPVGDELLPGPRRALRPALAPAAVASSDAGRFIAGAISHSCKPKNWSFAMSAYETQGPRIAAAAVKPRAGAATRPRAAVARLPRACCWGLEMP